MQKARHTYYLLPLLILALLAPLGFMSYTPLYTKSAILMSGMLFLLLLWKALHGPQNTQLKTQSAAGPEIVDLDESSAAFREVSEPNAVKERQAENKVPSDHKPAKMEAPSMPPSTPPFEQERWNLPGFQSLLRPFRKGISADEFNLVKWESFYSDSSPSQSSSKQNYAFPALSLEKHGQALGSLNNLEAFVKEMLISLSEYLAPCSVSACLRSRSGKYHLFLQFSGSVFFSEKNTEMEGGSWQAVIQRIETGEYVVLNGGQDIAFPLPSRFGPLGFLHFRCEEALANKDDKKDILEKLWYAIRKYGESLLQACIYEQSTKDPESTLFNGMRFQEDLNREMACRLERNIPCHLILVMLHGKVNAEALAACSKNLLLLFPFPQRVYRIGQSLFGILDTREAQGLKTKLSELRVSMQQTYGLELSFGSAIPVLELGSPQEWFEQAQKALE